MRTKLIIEDWVERQSSKGKAYLAMKTNIGNVSAFDIGIAGPVIEAPKGSVWDAEVEENNGYRNMVHLYVQSPIAPPSAPPVSESQERRVSVVMSYVKDLVAAGKVNIGEYKPTCKLFLEIYSELAEGGI